MRDYQQLLNEAMDAAEAGKNTKAIKFLSKVVAVYPQEPQAYFERAIAFLNLDKDAEARTDLEAALTLRPDYPGAREWLARVLTGQGHNLLAAELQLKAVLASGESHDKWAVSPQAWADCANYFLEASEVQKARETLELYFARYEERVDAYACYATAPWRIYASILAKTGEVSAALDFAQKAALHPGHAPADEFVWIECLAHSGQLERARSEFAKRADFKGTVSYELTSKTLQGLGQA
ncbi:tetratricopeptide repeat protein [Nodosilinea sp. AN01ver1]|uniref:tetratricopeptide repeat protein n=1 Tax=Nodosilinea sp. AN01ver1 TaxID=3423362 RepID=UPI003D312AB9